MKVNIEYTSPPIKSATIVLGEAEVKELLRVLDLAANDIYGFYSLRQSSDSNSLQFIEDLGRELRK